MNHITKELEQYRQDLQTLITYLEKAVQNVPDGRLRITRRGNACAYYHCLPTNSDSRISHLGKYIPKEQLALAKALAQKNYDQKMLLIAQKQLSQVDRFLHSFDAHELETCFSRLNPMRRELIIPRVLPEQDYISHWQNRPFPKTNTFPFSETELFSKRGERVRSKSEKIIADALFEAGVPYLYEFPLQTSSEEWIFPDFTVLNPHSRQEFIWEHFGRMDDADYSQKAYRKIHNYYRLGFIPGKNLIYTFETLNQPLSTKNIEMFIQEYLC